jgi:hypothetical protein
MGRIAAFTLPALLLWASSARASDLALEWSAPRGCPSRDGIRDGLTTRLGREVTLSTDAAVELQGTVVALGGGYSLELRTHSAHGSERRELRARSCNELARASILVAALLLMDDAAANTTRSQARVTDDLAGPESARAAFSAYARTWLRGDLGSLPAAAWGPGLALGIALNRTQLELGGTYLPAQSMRAVGRAQSVGSMQLMAAHASACQVLIAAPELAPCLRAEVGRLQARGENLAQTASVSRLWLLGAVGLRLGFELSRGLFWQTEVAAGMPLERVRLAVRNLELNEVRRTPAVIGRLETGLVLSF